jgi:hypothetical protein
MAVPTDTVTFHSEGTTPGAVLQEVSVINSLPYRNRRERWTRLHVPATKHTLASTSPPDLTRSQLPVPTALTDGILDALGTARLRIPGWYRHVIMLSKTKEAKEAAKANKKGKPKINALSPAPALDVVEGTSKPPPVEALSNLWYTNEETTISAALGQVIHRAPAATVSKGVSKFTSASSTFLPSVPNLPLLLPHLPNCSESKIVLDTLSFRLIQETWLSEGGSYFPEIRMEFKVSSLGEKTQSAEFCGMYAIIGSQSAYTLLPTCAVDLCFSKKVVIRMNPEGIKASEKINAYIEKTKENILGSGALRAPTQINIPLPFWTVDKIEVTTQKEGGKSSTAPASQKDCAKDPEFLMGNYFFVGVEHRETLSFNYKNLDLCYNSVEAGKMGGHYGELALTSKPVEVQRIGTEVPSVAPEIQERRELVNSAFELVELVEKAVQGTLGAGAGQIKKEKVPEKMPPKYWTKPENTEFHQREGEGGETVRAAAAG